MRFPVDNFKTQFNTTAGNAFGAKVSYGYHSGADINGNGGGNTDTGTPLKAIASGIITSVVYQYSGYGNHLHLQFKTTDGRTYYAHYCHCQTIYVKAGQTVAEGDLLATLGNTGNSTYAHLHFEIKNQPTGIDGIAKTTEDLKKWENPIPFIEKHMIISLTPAQKEQKIRTIFGQNITSEERLRQSDIVIHG